VNVLLGVWALVPWLDRKAQRGESSPGFADFGVGAIRIVAYLTLEVWDIGGGEGALPDVDAVAHRGREAIAKGQQLIEEVEAEHRFRRSGLVVSLGFMVLLAVAIYPKIRGLESKG